MHERASCFRTLHRGCAALPTALVICRTRGGEVVDLEARRLRTTRACEEAAAERARAAKRTADAAEEALTLDELVAEADARERAAKRATRRVLRRLAY